MTEVGVFRWLVAGACWRECDNGCCIWSMALWIGCESGLRHWSWLGSFGSIQVRYGYDIGILCKICKILVQYRYRYRYRKCSFLNTRCLMKARIQKRSCIFRWDDVVVFLECCFNNWIWLTFSRRVDHKILYWWKHLCSSHGRYFRDMHLLCSWRLNEYGTCSFQLVYGHLVYFKWFCRKLLVCLHILIVPTRFKYIFLECNGKSM